MTARITTLWQEFTYILGVRFDPERDADELPVCTRTRTEPRTRTETRTDNGVFVLPKSKRRARYADDGAIELVDNVHVSGELTDADREMIATHEKPKLKESRYLNIKVGMSAGWSMERIIESLPVADKCKERTFETYRSAILKAARGVV